ncbi:nucleotidyltransferase family protein [Nitrospira defluvii]|nr:nucleotidyltransferase family protein [Nitrospira defluvii]
MAAGLGTRLGPLTDDMPKPLLPVGGRPLIDYNLLLLKKYGITEVLINLHHYGEKIVQKLGNGSNIGMKIRYSEESRLLGTGGGIKKMASNFGDETFVVINGDIVIEIELENLISFHREKEGLSTLVLRKEEDLSPFGIIEIDRNNRVQNILDKIPWDGKDKRQLMFTGLHIIEPKVLDYIPRDTFYSITDAYIDMLQNGEKLYGYINDHYWNDLGHLDRYNQVNQALNDGTLQISHVQ